MLVLTRRKDEAIVINGRIRVEVKHITGSRVRLAIDAPSEVAVDRDEVWIRRQQDSEALRRD